jgi:hypothetical protein
MLTDQERETLAQCDACMSVVCSVCGHEPCPVCADDCDHQECIEWDKRGGHGTKKHVCVFVRCEQHRAA